MCTLLRGDSYDLVTIKQSFIKNLPPGGSNPLSFPTTLTVCCDIFVTIEDMLK